MNRSLNLLVIFFCLTISLSASGKELYVDANIGDDNVSYADNNASTPWATLRRAVFGGDSWDSRNSSQAPRAGDTVHIAAGIYYAYGSNNRAIPSFLNVNSGNATDGYITYQAEGFVDLRLSSGAGPVIGGFETGFGSDYIKWKGFYINEATAPRLADTGPIVVFGSSHITIEDCTIIGAPSTVIDNHNGIRFEATDGSIARNNTIRSIHYTVRNSSENSWHHNTAGIMLYSSRNIILEHNDIADAGVGIFPKGDYNYNITIRKNIIQNVKKGIMLMYHNAAMGQNIITQNVIKDGHSDASVGMESIGIEFAAGAHNYIVANNTIDNFMHGIAFNYYDQTNIVIQNNIITNTDTAFNSWNATTKFYSVNYNVYHLTNQWAHANRTYTSLSSWQSTISDDLNSITSDPLYLDAGADDFRLVGGSPATTLGVDLLDLNGNSSTTDRIPAGAFITGNEVIGRSGDAISPAAPVLLAVQ